MEPPRELLATLTQLPSHSLTEDEIELLWKFIVPRLKSGEAVSTTNGNPVQVREPGVVGHREGPDVCGATVEIGGAVRSGDVEIHSVASDWYHHEHHHDPCFNDVILQVSMDHSEAIKIRREDGRFVPTVRLKDSYDRCLAKLKELFEKAQDDRVAAVKRPCFHSGAEVPEGIHKDLDLAGQTWLLHRSARLRSRGSTSEPFGSIMGSLGYSRNHDNFTRLADRIDRDTFYRVIAEESPEAMEAWLMGKGGWLRRPFDGSVNRTIYRRRRVWETYWSGESRVLSVHDWNHSGIRPQAFPLRRLMWFGYATRHLNGDWEQWLLDNLGPIIHRPRFRKPSSRTVLTLFQLNGSRYWSRHYTRCDENHDASPAPFGPGWYDQFAVNVVLPWFYQRALSSGDNGLCDRILGHLRNYPPRLSNRRTKRVRKQWGLENQLEWRNVLEQQGVVFVYKHGCVEGKCEKCRFNRRDNSTQMRLLDRRR